MTRPSGTNRKTARTRNSGWARRFPTGSSSSTGGGTVRCSASVPLSAVSRAEQAGGSDPRLSTLERLVDACGLRLVVVDEEGTQLAVPYDQDQRRDRADRALPAHRGHPVRKHNRAVGLDRPRPPSLRTG